MFNSIYIERILDIRFLVFGASLEEKKLFDTEERERERETPEEICRNYARV